MAEVQTTNQIINKITDQKVREAFQGFGYEPDQADITYWTSKGEDRLDDMYEKLNARREKEQDAGVQWGGKVLDKGATEIPSTEKTWLMKFESDPDGPGPTTAATVFLVNNDDKTIRPFLNEEAFNNYMKRIGMPDITIQNAATKGLITLAPIDLINPGYALSKEKGFQILTNEKGITNNGTFVMDETPLNDNQLKHRYGYAQNLDAEKAALSILDNSEGGLLTLLKSTGAESGISPELIDEVSNDKNMVKFYVNALTYGGYDVPSIIQDLTRKQLVKDGKTEYKNMKVIDTMKPANEYYATTEGSSISTDPNLAPPQWLGNLDMETIKGLSIFQLPSEAFEELVPPFDPTSESGKAAMEEIEASHYDILMKQLQAVTEQEKALADASWRQFKEDLAREFNINVSDNAVEAWGQLQQFRNSSRDRGLMGTGLADETRDKFLQSVRRADEQLRDEKVATEKKQEASYLMNSGTPEQIQSFLNKITNPEERAVFERYFKPSSDVQQYFSIDNLRKINPDMTDDQLERYRNSLFDQDTGMYRSKLYQTMHERQFGPIEAPAEGIIPAKEAYQMGDIAYDEDGNLSGSGALFEREKERMDKEKELLGGGPFDSAVDSASTPTVPSTVISTQDQNNPWLGVPGAVSGQWSSREVAEQERPKYLANPSTYKYNQPALIQNQGSFITPGNDPLKQNKPTSNVMTPFTDWTKGKTDVTGKNWQGYEAISAPDYVPEKRNQWKNVQAVSGSLYGFRG